MRITGGKGVLLCQLDRTHSACLLCCCCLCCPGPIHWAKTAGKTSFLWPVYVCRGAWMRQRCGPCTVAGPGGGDMGVPPCPPLTPPAQEGEGALPWSHAPGLTPPHKAAKVFHPVGPQHLRARLAPVWASTRSTWLCAAGGGGGGGANARVWPVTGRLPAPAAAGVSRNARLLLQQDRLLRWRSMTHTPHAGACSMVWWEPAVCMCSVHVVNPSLLLMCRRLSSCVLVFCMGLPWAKQVLCGSIS